MAEVEAFLVRSRVARASWWLTERSTPADVEAQLLAAGATRVEDDYLHAGMLATSAPPEAPAAVTVRRADTAAEFIDARRLIDDIFDNPHMPRRSDEELAREFAEKPDVVYAGFVDGRIAGAGRVSFARCGGFLSGGATAQWARGRGVYRALVKARWDAAAARGTPALAVGAGPMSAPILRRLGFEQVLQLRRLESVV